MRLNQVIALVKGKKARATRTITDVYTGWKDSALTGISRTYQPLDEDGEKFPDEHTEVSLRVPDEIEKVKKQFADYMDIVATQERSNQSANADVKIDNKILLPNVPVTVLLFLEKQVTDLMTLTKKLPTLPVDKVWKFDNNKNCYVTDSEQKTKTQKKPEVIVKYQATKEHPAQTEVFTVDKTVGHWTTVNMSGAIPVKTKEEYITRLEQLQDALKSAREEANNLEVKTFEKIGTTVLRFIFG